jgi:hypothetical protein
MTFSVITGGGAGAISFGAALRALAFLAVGCAVAALGLSLETPLDLGRSPSVSRERAASVRTLFLVSLESERALL